MCFDFRQTDRQTDRQRQTNRQTDRQRQTNRGWAIWAGGGGGEEEEEEGEREREGGGGEKVFLFARNVSKTLHIFLPYVSESKLMNRKASSCKKDRRALPQSTPLSSRATIVVCDALGFVPAGNVSSSSTLQIFGDASHLW